MIISTENAAFVLIHGAWHNHLTWSELVPELESRGHAAVAIDLPGAGVNASNPQSLLNRPLDTEAFATESSPNAGVTQQHRTDAAIAAVRQASSLGNGRVVLVGHSLGGLTISPVAEAIPDEIGALVYLTAALLPPGADAGNLADDEASEGKVPALIVADPQSVGAIRIDVDSTDPEYLTTTRDAFYGDLTDDQFATALERLTHSDEPASVATVPSPVTAARMGQVERHFIHCTRDLAVTPATQDHLVAVTDEALGTKTTVHRLESSHSPFYSMPDVLADLLVSIATGVTK